MSIREERQNWNTLKAFEKMLCKQRVLWEKTDNAKEGGFMQWLSNTLLLVPVIALSLNIYVPYQLHHSRQTGERLHKHTEEKGLQSKGIGMLKSWSQTYWTVNCVELMCHSKYGKQLVEAKKLNGEDSDQCWSMNAYWKCSVKLAIIKWRVSGSGQSLFEHLFLVLFYWHHSTAIDFHFDSIDLLLEDAWKEHATQQQ